MPSPLRSSTATPSGVEPTVSGVGCGSPSVPVHAGASQWPEWQLVPPGQAWPQAPQFLSSVWVSTQRPEQRVPEAPEQVAAQAPALQTSPEAQALPQTPQFAGSIWLSAQ